MIAILFAVTACTQNQRARSYGGTETIIVAKNEEILNASWKGDQLWVLIKNKETNEITLQEKSSWGVVEGKIKFVNE